MNADVKVYEAGFRNGQDPSLNMHLRRLGGNRILIRLSPFYPPN